MVAAGPAGQQQPTRPRPAPGPRPPTQRPRPDRAADRVQCRPRVRPGRRAGWCPRPGQQRHVAAGTAAQPQHLHLVPAERRRAAPAPPPASCRQRSGEDARPPPPRLQLPAASGHPIRAERTASRQPAPQPRPGGGRGQRGSAGQPRPVPGGRRAPASAPSDAAVGQRDQACPRGDGQRRPGRRPEPGVEQAGRRQVWRRRRCWSPAGRRPGPGWAGTPTISEARRSPATTRPPLSATPAGVASYQRPAPAGRTNSCQKLFCGRPTRP